MLVMQSHPAVGTVDGTWLVAPNRRVAFFQYNLVRLGQLHVSHGGRFSG